MQEGGVVSVEDEAPSREVFEEDFSIHDDLLSDMAINGLQTVDPACTLRSTQQSNAEDPDATQIIDQSDDESQSHQQDEAPEETETSSFDIVSDSNSENDDESFTWNVVEE